MGTLNSVKEALDHLRDMLRLCRGDNLGLRDMVPVIMLRLDRDQQCYDFVKWWATLDSNFDFHDMSQPYLSIRDADVFEYPGFLLGDFPPLYSIIATILLKLKIIVDIRNIRVTRKVLAKGGVPPELYGPVELAVIRSPLSKKLAGKSAKIISETESTLRKQVCELGAALVKANGNFMFNLFDPDEALSCKPEAYSRGSWEEMVLAMQYSHAAFWETAGVLDLLKDARRCAVRDSEDEIEDMMEGETFNSGEGSSRTAEELLEDVSVNRIWGYLDYAIENASLLGPWSERPSERRTMKSRESWARAMREDAELDGFLDDDADFSDEST